ncbi:hypothetical protein [Streptomonospora litoralis]|uniref:Uncharacterized protein n=1 Tax=Streptomonospora litoralis TaxID=2498135 RepID=A0A4P6QB62_9ACTN|nr:hypothetical protein [Streptomonospora litoralis]QBI56794.1 hypothetical protein EKD16_25265 [Streptomonospora litoralis]
MIEIIGSTVAGGFVAEVTADVPPATQAGDRLLMFASANDEVEIVQFPTGWAVVNEELINEGAQAYTWLFTRQDQADDPDQVTVTWAGDHWHFLHIIALRGVAAIRTHATAVTGDQDAAQLDVPSLPAQRGDLLVVGGFHWDDTTKAFSPAGLEVVEHMDRGWITGTRQITREGPTTGYTVTAGTVGLMSTIAVLLKPTPAPAPPPTFPLTIRTELVIDGGWVDISADVRDTEPVEISRGRADETDTADASSCSLTINNRGGRFSPRNPGSPYFGLIGRNTPIRVSIVVDGTTIPRFTGEVAEWPVSWDVSDNDVWVPLKASGVLRRLGQGTAPEQSALRRFINARSPVAYWPLTDGATALVASPDAGPYDMAVVVDAPPGQMGTQARLDWREGSLAAWLEPVARTHRDLGRISGRVSSQDASTDWSVDMVRAGVGGQDRLVVMTRPDGAGTRQEWRVRFDQEAPDMRVWVRLVPEDAAVPGFTHLGVSDDARFFTDQLRHVRLRVADNGAGESDWGLWVDGELLLDGTTSGFAAPEPPGSAQYWWNLREPAAPEGAHASIGHITVWDEQAVPAPPSAQEVTQAMYGHTGEPAGVRIARVAAEQGLAFEAVGDLELTPPMGPQRTEAPLAVMREAEQVDDGVLYESRSDIALIYRTTRSRYNQGGRQ